MRARSVAGAVVVVVLAWATGAAAQTALRAAQPLAHQIPARGAFTLRPAPALRPLVDQVAAVLELRTGAHVDVGSPPPETLEAIPAGHIAVAAIPGGVVLVLSAEDGQSFTARVQLADSSDADARALALAVESLHDMALDAPPPATAASRHTPVSPASSASPAGDAPAPPAAARPSLQRAAGPYRDDFDPDLSEEQPWRTRFLDDIEWLAYLKAYGGASSASTGLESGLGGGLGVCAAGQCLVLAAELPVTAAATNDLRYRYTTYSAAFLSRPEPLRFAVFQPGASIGLVTRVGHFNDDMGLADEGLDTDLAARGAAELAWLAHRLVDVVLQGGVDYLLDRDLLSARGASVSRGQRITPWVQAALRVTPY